MPSRSSGFFLQSTLGTLGNFEAVVPSALGGLVHVWRNHDDPGVPWMPPRFFGSGFLEAASLIQAHQASAPGDLEVVVRLGDGLAHFRCEERRWQEPFYFASGISGKPALIQSSYGNAGNYELVVPVEGGLAHFVRDNDEPGHPWAGPAAFAAGVGPVEGVALIQSNFGDPGSLEVIANIRSAEGNGLWHFWRDNEWHGPFAVPLTGLPAEARPAGTPGFIQSRFGNNGHFALVTALSSGGFAHLRRDNDDPALPWILVAQFGSGVYTDVSLIHGSFGNLEMLARRGNRWEHFFQDAATSSWSGPAAVAYEDPVTERPVLGEWQVPYSAAIVGIHAALLNTGNILLFTYHSEFDQGTGESCVVDPHSGAAVELPRLEKNPFCGGHAFLPDGRLLVAGGHATGLRSVHTFEPEDSGGSWQEVAEMPEGRWYPTCTALPDGRVFILSGSKPGGPAPAAEVNESYEIYSAGAGLTTPVPVPFLAEINPVPLYPFVFLLPDGRLVVHAWNKTCLVDPTTWEFGAERVLTIWPHPRNSPVQGSAVLLPLLPSSDPSYRARVMLIGGGGVPPSTHEPATETCEILDLGATPLEWRAAAPMAGPRVMLDAVLLPDATVLVVNGSSAGWSHDADDPVYRAEIYHPNEDAWTTVCPTRVPRLYHSTALLLADGRVMTAGTDEAFNIEPFHKSELRLELFSPPYLCRGPRPRIVDAPPEIGYGETFRVRTSDDGSIASAALMRPGAVSHSFNMEQRYVGMEIGAANSDGLRLTAPPNANVAPPGYYMLFLVNQAGVPSVARFVRLS